VGVEGDDCTDLQVLYNLLKADAADLPRGVVVNAIPAAVAVEWWSGE
jgi:hypothetical protein